MAMHGIPCVRRGQDGFARPGHPRARARERVGVLGKNGGSETGSLVTVPFATLSYLFCWIIILWPISEKGPSFLGLAACDRVWRSPETAFYHPQWAEPGECLIHPLH